MSQGDPMPRERALAAAQRLVAVLEPSCARIAIAGSLRREKPLVRDIEIVATARWEDVADDDLWGELRSVNLLESSVERLLIHSDLEARHVEQHRADGSIDRVTKLGPAFKALVFEDIPVDLFIVRPPATWGCIFALRTGPGDWNTRLVTDCKTIGRRVEGGRVQAWTSASNSWQDVPTPEEADFFRALGQRWVEPRERQVDRVRISRQTLAEVAS